MNDMGSQFKAEMLDPLTLDSISAYALRHHMRKGEAHSHFNKDVPALTRIAAIGELFGKAASLAVLEDAQPERLGKTLIELAALAAIWAEVVDKNRCTCSYAPTVIDDEVVSVIRTPNPVLCPVHP